MRMDFALLARAANTAEGHLFIHGGGIRGVEVEGLPAAVPLALAARFAADLEENGSSHFFTLRGLQPGGETLFESGRLEFTLSVEGSDPDDPEISVLVAITMGTIPLAQPGRYEVQFFVDGGQDPVATLPLYVRVAAGSPDPAS